MGFSDKVYEKWYKREHYLDNKDEYAWKLRLWRELNKERYKANRRDYYQKNKDREREHKRKWVESNRERMRELNRESWDRRKEFVNCVRRLQTKLDKIK